MPGDCHENARGLGLVLHCFLLFCFVYFNLFMNHCLSFCCSLLLQKSKVSILIIYYKCEMKLGDQLVDHQFFLNLLDYWALSICFLFET